MTSPQTTSFESLKLLPELLAALEHEGYHTATPIQSQAIPHVLEGRDLLGCAQTGTGKTAAFALPILQNLHNQKPKSPGAIRTLVLTPTRELAAQIVESFDRYGAKLGLRTIYVFGGVGQAPQVAALRRSPEILVATPGRLLDLIEQRHVSLGNLEIFVLDEADRMLDMGFIHDVRRVLKHLPAQRQSLFFSATMPPDIQRLAHDILIKPVKVEVTPVATTAEKIDQSIYFVEKDYKRDLLKHLLQDASISRALVFTRTKHGADKVARTLNQAGVKAEAIHGNKSQNNRVRALENFKQGQTRILVATDIAARGIDIDGVSHVIIYDLPNIPESYVHRIGRTARAGAEGVSISFCDTEERAYLRDIERTIRMKVPVVDAHPYAGLAPKPRDPESEDSRRDSARRGHGGRGGSGRRGGESRRGGETSQRSGGSRGERPARAAQPAQSSARTPRPTGEPNQRRPAAQPRQENRSAKPRSEGDSTRRPEGRSRGNRGRGHRKGNNEQSPRTGQQGPRSASRSQNSARETKPAAPAAGKLPWWKRLTGLE